jgi:SAM-dependent methyltransferase
VNAGGERPPPEAVVWHDVECGGYAADLPLWRELAEAAGGPVLEVGAGTGRVALDLARRGHDVTALDRDPVLLAELERQAGEISVRTIAADAREVDLEPAGFALVLVPMQTVQLFGGAEGRAPFLRRAHAHLRPGGLLAAALTGPLDEFDAAGTAPLPLPDVAQHAGWAYFSQPVAVRTVGEGTVIERVRQTISPTGARHEHHDEVRLDALDADTLAAEAAAHGFTARPPRAIPATTEHVASTVALLQSASAGRGPAAVAGPRGPG